MKDYKGHTRGGVSEEEVVRYLQANSDFFHRNSLLLTHLSVPHPESGNAISLIERQVGILREQKQELQRKLRQIAQAAVANEQLLLKIEQLVTALLDVSDSNTFVARVEQTLWDEFAADAVTVWLFTTGPTSPFEIAPDAPGVRAFAKVLEQREPICGHLSNDQRHTLFPGEQAEAIRSVVVIPLCGAEGGDCLGLLAVGSEDPKRFHPEMGTTYIRHLGVLLGGILGSRARRDG